MKLKAHAVGHGRRFAKKILARQESINSNDVLFVTASRQDPKCEWSILRPADFRCLIHGSRLILNRLVDLSAMNSNILRRLDTEADFVPTDLDHGDRDVIVDDDALVFLAGENQHCRSSLVPMMLGTCHPSMWLNLVPGKVGMPIAG